MLLWVIIGVVLYLAVASVVLGACAAAARGDRDLPSALRPIVGDDLPSTPAPGPPSTLNVV